MKASEVIEIYDSLGNIKIENFNTLLNLDFTKLSKQKIHHVGFITPNSFDEKTFKQLCVAYCNHEKFKSLLGYFFIDDVIIELIRPTNMDSVLSKDIDLDHFKFDHLCFYDKHFNFTEKIKITDKIYTRLFDKYVSFELLNFKYKIEIIY